MLNIIYFINLNIKSKQACSPKSTKLYRTNTPGFSSSVWLVMSMQENPPWSQYLPKVLKMTVMDLHVCEFSTIFTSNKLAERVQLDMKLWVSMKKASKSFLKDSIKTKTNIGKKLPHKATKLSLLSIFVVMRNILRQLSVDWLDYLQILEQSSLVRIWVCKKWLNNTLGFVSSWRFLSLL